MIQGFVSDVRNLILKSWISIEIHKITYHNKEAVIVMSAVPDYLIGCSLCPSRLFKEFDLDLVQAM